MAAVKNEVREASRTDEGRYRMLIDAITDYAIYMLDTSGIVTSWNAGAQRFKGYTADEILGQHFSRFYTEDEREAGLPNEALRIAARQGRFEREGWRVRKDGSRFWAHVVIDPIRTPGGELVGYAKITRDLTERKIAEEALRSSERQFRLLVEGVTDYAIFMLDATGHVANWNPGAQRIKGYRPEEIIGEHFSKFYPEEERTAGAPEESLEIARREGRWEKEGWRVRKDGTRFFAHVVIDAIRDERGEVIGFAKVTRDITERMETQKALELAREALFQSQKMDAIGQLTGGIAHDFNNLLMAVLGSLELVRKRLPFDPKVTPLLENAIQGAERGTALTQRMLAFARKTDLALEAVDLSQLVHGMVRLLQSSIGPAIDITVRFPPDLPPVRTDSNQLETGLLNLAVNARDAMPNGGNITIAATAETVAGADGPLEAGEYVRLCVSDTGAGMDPETLARATEPFFTTKGVGKGTGLGLSMVHGLAAQSGGRLTIQSRLGEGTTIALWLPVATTNADAPRRPSEAGAPLGKARSLRILTVDDDRLVLLNTAALLEDLGHAVLQAPSGKQALRILEREPDLDLMITDQAMPEMTGLQLREAAAKIRPELPVLIATGYAELPPDAGADLPRISKPFTQSELARAVRDIMRDRNPAATEGD